jgi:hypothetical protein
MAKAKARSNETWRDQEHRARPTPERLRHGAWVTRDSSIAGQSYAVDEAAHPLDVLHALGTITDDQRQAGLDAAELFARNQLVSQGRSCLNFDPVGHDSDTPDDEPAYWRYRDLYGKLGQTRASAIRDVCVRAETPKRSKVAMLVDALSVCEAFFSPRLAKARKIVHSCA